MSEWVHLGSKWSITVNGSSLTTATIQRDDMPNIQFLSSHTTPVSFYCICTTADHLETLQSICLTSNTKLAVFINRILSFRIPPKFIALNFVQSNRWVMSTILVDHSNSNSTRLALIVQGFLHVGEQLVVQLSCWHQPSQTQITVRFHRISCTFRIGKQTVLESRKSHVQRIRLDLLIECLHPSFHNEFWDLENMRKCILLLSNFMWKYFSVRYWRLVFVSLWPINFATSLEWRRSTGGYTTSTTPFTRSTARYWMSLWMSSWIPIPVFKMLRRWKTEITTTLDSPLFG